MGLGVCGDVIAQERFLLVVIMALSALELSMKPGIGLFSARFDGVSPGRVAVPTLPLKVLLVIGGSPKCLDGAVKHLKWEFEMLCGIPVDIEVLRSIGGASRDAGETEGTKVTRDTGYTEGVVDLLERDGLLVRRSGNWTPSEAEPAGEVSLIFFP